MLWSRYTLFYWGVSVYHVSIYIFYLLLIIYNITNIYIQITMTEKINSLYYVNYHDKLLR